MCICILTFIRILPYTQAKQIGLHGSFLSLIAYRVQVLKLCAFWYMHQECQAFQQLPDWKKQIPIDLSSYDPFLLSKEKWQELYKEKLSAQASDLKTLDQIEAAMAQNKEEVEMKQKTRELQEAEVRGTSSFVPIAYDASVCESGAIVHSVDLDVQSEVVQTSHVETLVQSATQCDPLHTLVADPTFVEFDLSDLFNTQPDDKTFVVDSLDHMYAVAVICSEHQYAQVSSDATQQKHQKSSVSFVTHVSGAHKHVQKSVKHALRCVVTKAKK